ncbi:MAG: hypothetical protein C0602_11275 [Denitrovibrio sp.]|nr:MAG: hypothetical protein C0602_11275 [Denitrovibrio sp.]
MSDNTKKVMKEHLQIAENYINALDTAESKKDLINAINTCKKEILAQYKDLEEISEDFYEKITGKKDKELFEISDRVGNIFSKEVTAYYVKMGPYMADQDFMAAFAEFDQIIGSNPLFGQNEFGQDIAAKVSTAIAGEMDSMATRMMADSSETDENIVTEIAELMNRFLDISKRYIAKLDEAVTARKVVTATDGYVNAITKMIPEMKAQADQLKLIMARNDKPAQITNAADELKRVLGDDLKEVMKNKQELFNEQKVQKSVSKLGDILNKVPF